MAKVLIKAYAVVEVPIDDDNPLLGAHSGEEGSEFVENMVEMLTHGSFRMAGWDTKVRVRVTDWDDYDVVPED